MYGQNLSGSPKPAPSTQADKATRQAAAAAMQIERGRSNPGFAELPSVASSIAAPCKQPQACTAPQTPQTMPTSGPAQQQTIPQQQQAPQAPRPPQPHIAPPPASVPVQQTPTTPQIQREQVFSRPAMQQQFRPTFTAPNAMPWPRMPAPINPWAGRGYVQQQYRPPVIPPHQQIHQPEQQPPIQHPD